jgi:hypothetical protein
MRDRAIFSRRSGKSQKHLMNRGERLWQFTFG